MKHLFSTLAIAVVMLFSSASASAQSLSDLLKGLGGQGQSTSTENTSTQTGSSIGDILSGVAGALGLGNSKAGIEQLAGTWAYAGPAVSFKSDNLLLKAGGAAAATTVEKKLEPYYSKVGLTKLVITINNDSTFTFQANRVTLNGTINRNDDAGTYVFNFQAFNKINIGSMEAFIQLTGNNMELTFDVSKLMTIMQRVSALSGSSTLQGASALLEQYDGMTAGFDLKRSN